MLHIDPIKKLSSRVLWLSFWAEVHYNSLYPEGRFETHHHRDVHSGACFVSKTQIGSRVAYLWCDGNPEICYIKIMLNSVSRILTATIAMKMVA